MTREPEPVGSLPIKPRPAQRPRVTEWLAISAGFFVVLVLGYALFLVIAEAIYSHRNPEDDTDGIGYFFAIVAAVPALAAAGFTYVGFTRRERRLWGRLWTLIGLVLAAGWAGLIALAYLWPA